ncbi:ABC transporter transmembrane domain-containing protein [Ancylobacter sp. SL191]|jgi:ATP-binding cassette subfamily B protein|uniref:ABC transporter transmembrane domain-containing protein n=1 Tax=Ancylobacter sp. SL191 TaxID=2995166 RepID=UPI00226D8ABE|nr:ABC transporter transmembrane domain-containing protein [Ancylobacter sp. SL191]WAC28912.1 ABC transporter transmembrane domain-containing protein [Ancylobacter sp. SL191]
MTVTQAAPRHPVETAPTPSPALAVPPPAPNAARPRLKPLAALWPHILRYRGRATAALLALIVAALATLVVPIAVRRMIDFGFDVQHAGFIDRYFAVMIGVVAVLAVASSARYYLVMTLGERIVADLRSQVFAHLLTLDGRFYDQAKSGELISRLTADTTQIKSAVGASASVALRNIVLFIGAAVMMVVTSPWLSAALLIAIPVIVAVLIGAGRGVRKRSRGAQDTLAEASAFAAEAIGAVRALQANTAEPAADARFAGEVEHAFNAAAQAVKARAWLTGFGIFLVFASVVGILWAGANAVLAGTMSAGTLGQFVLYAVLAASGLGQLGEVWGEISQAAGATERIAELLEERPAVAPPASPRALPQPPRGEVAFQNVRFAYPGRPDLTALDGVSFAVKPGERVAIVGPSGAGKSTLFQLLLRFYDPTAGSVSVDGVDIAAADPSEVRERLALVPQDVAIFAASIRDNIRLGSPQASDAEVEEAGRLARADEFVARLPEGWDTPVGERGVTLSGGQRQRLAIARAILRRAPILLLDEATSALDAESETLVQQALDRSMQGRTTLVIAHRLATVLSADRILVMEHGRVVEEGTHASLVAQGGLYARLAALQFGEGNGG